MWRFGGCCVHKWRTEMVVHLKKLALSFQDHRLWSQPSKSSASLPYLFPQTIIFRFLAFLIKVILYVEKKNDSKCLDVASLGLDSTTDLRYSLSLVSSFLPVSPIFFALHFLHSMPVKRHSTFLLKGKVIFWSHWLTRFWQMVRRGWFKDTLQV